LKAAATPTPYGALKPRYGLLETHYPRAAATPTPYGALKLPTDILDSMVESGGGNANALRGTETSLENNLLSLSVLRRQRQRPTGH